MAEGEGSCVLLRLAAVTESPRGVPSPVGEVYVSCRAAPDRAEPSANEDGAGVWCLGSGASVLVVADGVGAYGNGQEAVRALLESFDAALGRDDFVPSQFDSGSGAVLGAIDDANRALLDESPSPAAGIMVAWIDERGLRTHHAGDVEALVVGQRGKIKLTTMTHGPVGYARAAELLTEQEARAHEERHLVSNVVGMPALRVEVMTGIALAPRDTVVLGTDGLFDALSRQAIADIVRSGPLDECAAELERAVDAHVAETGYGDDCTFMLFRPSA